MLAGLESRADLKAQALEGNVVELPIVSTALLSPGKLVGPATNDAKFLKEQNDAWRNACDNEGICTITIKDDDGNDKIIRVKPKVIKFNFGINFLSHTVLGRMVSLGGGWGKSDSMIKEGIKELIGKPQKNNPNNIAEDSLVGSYLQNNPNIDVDFTDDDEYIESLKVHMEEMGFKDEEQSEEINRMKKQNKVILEMKNNKNLSWKEIGEMLGVKNTYFEDQ